MARHHRDARDQDARNRGPSQRQLRVAELIRHALADVLMRGDLHAPELAGTVVTVSEVRTSPDLKHATAFVAPLGGGDTAPVVAAMRKAKGFLRARVARAVDLKYAPELHFEPDTSFDYADKMNRVLHSPKVAADLARPDEPDAETSDPDEDA